MNTQLLNNLTPVHKADSTEWQKITQAIANDATLVNAPLFWYGGSAFDTLPLQKLYQRRFPKEAQQLLSPHIFPVFTDYNKELVGAFQTVYNNFESGDFSELENLFWFNLSKISILQIIPLTLFDEANLNQIRNKYPNNFHSCVTPSVIPDDKWHFVYLHIRIGNQDHQLMYGLIENLTFWQEVVKPYQLDVDCFCALRVGGKSGSWDNTHSPESKLFQAIQQSDIRPKLWIADNYFDIKKVWQEIAPFDGYGEMHFFKTDWSCSV